MPRGVMPSLRQGDFAFLVSEVGDRPAGDIGCNILIGPPLGLNPEDARDFLQLSRILYRIARIGPLGCHEEGLGHGAAVVRMGGRARSHHPCEVAGDDNFGRGPAYAARAAFAARLDAAGAHVTDAAAEALLAEGAVGLLAFLAIPHGFGVAGLPEAQHVFDGLVDAAFFHAGFPLPGLGCRIS
jgi:hypothetical protein